MGTFMREGRDGPFTKKKGGGGKDCPAGNWPGFDCLEGNFPRTSHNPLQSLCLYVFYLHLCCFPAVRYIKDADRIIPSIF